MRMMKPETCRGCVFYDAPDRRFCGPQRVVGSEVAIIAERPGETELEEGVPLHPDGKTGQQVRRAIGECGKSASLTNVLKCAGKPGATPLEMDLAIEACAERYLNKELEEWKPERVLVLGGLALWAVMGQRNPLRFHGSSWTRSMWESLCHPS